MPEGRTASDVVAIVPTVGRPESLAACLASLGAQSTRPGNVCVVHSGADAGTAAACEAAAARFGFVVTYAHSPHRGAALQRDLAIRASSQPLLLLCEDDVEYEPSWTETLLNAIEGDARIGAVMGHIVNQPVLLPRGLWAFYRRVIAPSRASEPGAVIGPLLTNGFPVGATAPMATEWIGGGVTLMRREAYLSVGGFAAHFRDSSPGEDVDLGFRMSRRWRLLYVPAARCFHNQIETGRDHPAYYHYLSVRSRFAHCRVSAGKGQLATYGHIALWAVFQTLSELGQLRRGRLRPDFLAATWGRVHGAWSCVGWNPAAERFPDAA